ncbi:transporter substrate-binding domain-containing protein [Companilactobacillus sp.]|jgi:cystine transport system substrate-binding protein|uniref:transporter substrate-binding domain-containing protein n=1 Tax=Companilactobacillus sp. TaxID=2767905 RepID=UPI0025BC8029|nr:transporter substrate-binding domain-containing protein [Companilactobacillus sp.]MCH4008876.1 transporter substrate-binding domain-containing protein [Companilactobacillus sp.]MCH4050945.1 transporter substrate-binding domain-containing protein [Companilactobacillus sp.]MCH4076819.1 transporter substrate-binding domain-containing protein [Companilactobacillus sp.]MCH4125394.1 transporter substrate-binding domain-containing protein [Companilactobacillus sp.]MCH4131936.1 transporter substrat
MKKKLILILTMVATFALVLAGCSNSSSETKTKGTLTIGLEGTFAPYSYRENGKLTGFEVEYAKALAKKMDLKAKFVPTKWDSLIAGLNSKTFDVVINNVGETSDRQKHYIFADPYVKSKSVLVTKSDNSKIKSVDDLKGVKVAEGTGTDNYNYAKKFGADIVPSSDYATTMSMIKQGRVQATINSREAFLTWQKDNKNNNLKYSIVPTSKIPNTKIAPIFNKDSTKLRDKVKKAQAELKKDGTLKRLSIKYFGENISD